ncbi:hypothetical protein V2J09_000607 [Rumex salicifolius]
MEDSAATITDLAATMADMGRAEGGDRDELEDDMVVEVADYMEADTVEAQGLSNEQGRFSIAGQRFHLASNVGMRLLHVFFG